MTERHESSGHLNLNHSVEFNHSVEAVPPQQSPLDFADESTEPSASLQTLAILWARKYVSAVETRREAAQAIQSAAEHRSDEGRRLTAGRLRDQLSLASAQAWSTTETLLAGELQAHDVNPSLIRPLEIAQDSQRIFERALDAYAQAIAPRKLSVLIGQDIGKVRQRYTAQDPRVIGFVSLQFHHTGQTLLNGSSQPEQNLLQPYLKVMDDHMYMPLRETYLAAADHSPQSPKLQAVQRLLPISSTIAQLVCKKIRRVNSGYRSYSGSLRSESVRSSSVRDVEMFQIYLCLSVLSSGIEAVQRELFPLCVMLYPPLGVKWSLVQDMLQALTWEMADQLDGDDMAVFIPYLRLFSDMFSREVFSVT